MSVSTGANYVRQIKSDPDGNIILLPNERILSGLGDHRNGFVVTVTGVGIAPKDTASINVRPPLPTISTPVEWPSPNTI